MEPLAILLVLVASGRVASAIDDVTPPAKVKIVLAGDSTVTQASGWGRGLAQRCGPRVECVNIARGGRSSKSYRDEGWWKQVIEARPSYVLIQFGHNDQPGKGPERETDPKTTFRENLARYVREARAAGAAPVLITSMERRKFDDNGKIVPSLTDYADATRQVAADEKVPLIDLHARSIALYERLGPAGCESISPRKDGVIDATHLNAKGAKIVGQLVADELAKAVPELAEHLRAEPPAEPGRQ